MPPPDGRAAGSGGPTGRRDEAGNPAGAGDLGRRELSPRETAEFRGLLHVIQSRTGFCCEGYKERVLRRRIAVRMRAKGARSFGAYAVLLQNDPDEYQRLVDTVTINVSKFFRNASTWVLLRDLVIPGLFELDAPTMGIWSAGAAAGEEAYSLAILLLQHAAEHGSSPDRFRILGTDVDSDALARAREAEYDALAFTEMADTTRDRWFEGPRRNRLRAEVKERVEFARLDLMTDPFPREQHLILCRNVLIYFERAVQLSLFERFHEATVPGGYLQLGKVETLFGAPPGLYETINARERLFRRS